MSAIVTPVAIQVVLPEPGADQKAPGPLSSTMKAEEPFPAPEDPHTRKVARLAKLLEKCVQDKQLRADFLVAAQEPRLALRRTHSASDLLKHNDTSDGTLRRSKSSSSLRWETWSLCREAAHSVQLLAPHSDVVPSAYLPFEQRPYVYSKHATGKLGGFFDSFILATCGAVFTVCATTYAMIWNTSAAVMALSEENGSVGVGVGMSVSIGCLLVGSTQLILDLLDMPCRVLLFYRLWEHKLVINFKQRTLAHRATMAKLAVLGLIGLYNLLFGYFGLHASQSYYIAFLQGSATLSWVVYANINPDAKIFSITSAVRHQKGLLKSTQTEFVDVVTKPSNGPESTENRIVVAASIMPRLGACFHDIAVVDEVDVKYDMFALFTCRKEIHQRTRKFTNKTTDLERFCVEEEKAWVRALMTWIGRLHNTKASLGSKVTRSDHDKQGAVFRALYDDKIWHACGSFAAEKNAVEASLFWGKVILFSIRVHMFVMLALLFGPLMRRAFVDLFTQLAAERRGSDPLGP